MLIDCLGQFGEGKSPFQSQPISKEDFDFFHSFYSPPKDLFRCICVCMYTQMCRCQRRLGEGTVPHGVRVKDGVTCLIQMLGLKLGSSAGTVGALSH